MSQFRLTQQSRITVCGDVMLLASTLCQRVTSRWSNSETRTTSSFGLGLGSLEHLKRSSFCSGLFSMMRYPKMRCVIAVVYLQLSLSLSAQATVRFPYYLRDCVHLYEIWLPLGLISLPLFFHDDPCLWILEIINCMENSLYFAAIWWV